MKHWTIEDVQNFDSWLRDNKYGWVEYPVLENNNGNFTISIVTHELAPVAQNLVDQYDKEVVNGQ